jgi:hypothetical protein
MQDECDALIEGKATQKTGKTSLFHLTDKLLFLRGTNAWRQLRVRNIMNQCLKRSKGTLLRTLERSMAQVPGNGIDPGVKLALFAETPGFSISLKEGFLCDVFCILSTSGHPISQPIDLSSIGSIQERITLWLSVSQVLNEFTRVVHRHQSVSIARGSHENGLPELGDWEMGQKRIP